MKMQRRRPRHLWLLIVSTVVVLSSTAGVAAIKGWLPASSADLSDIPAPQRSRVATVSEPAVVITARAARLQAGVRARANGTCAECGRIVSMKEIDGRDTLHTDAAVLLAGYANENPLNPSKRYEIVVRMADGSSRIINDASPTNWLPGARVIIIDGTIPSNR